LIAKPTKLKDLLPNWVKTVTTESVNTGTYTTDMDTVTHADKHRSLCHNCFVT